MRGEALPRSVRVQHGGASRVLRGNESCHTSPPEARPSPCPHVKHHSLEHTPHAPRHTLYATYATPHTPRHTLHTTYSTHSTPHTPHAPCHTLHATRSTHAPRHTLHTLHATHSTPHSTRAAPLPGRVKGSGRRLAPQARQTSLHGGWSCRTAGAESWKGWKGRCRACRGQ